MGGNGPLRAMKNSELWSSPREQNKSPIKEQSLPLRAPLPCHSTKISELLWISDYHMISTFPFYMGVLSCPSATTMWWACWGLSIGLLLLLHEWMDQKELYKTSALSLIYTWMRLWSVFFGKKKKVKVFYYKIRKKIFVTGRTNWGRFYFTSQLLAVLPYEMIIHTTIFIWLSAPIHMDDCLFDIRLEHKPFFCQWNVRKSNVYNFQQKINHVMVHSSLNFLHHFVQLKALNRHHQMNSEISTEGKRWWS